MRRSAGRSGSARWIDRIDEQAIRELVKQWFQALAQRQADVLIGMTTPDVQIRPFLARQTPDAVTYRGHDGIREWVASLDSRTQITLDLQSIEVTSEQSAVVEAEVWYDLEGSRTGGMTWSVWRFDGGKLSESVGYGSKDDALAAEGRTWQ
jgi:ketosteroid isomerase-like protein